MASELYFRHIIDARKHIKIYQLEKQFGRHIAYAYYFKTLELMAELSECGLKTANLQDYSEYLQIDNDTFNQFIQYCVEIDLFIDHDGLITAERLIENMQKIKSKSINMSKAAIRREKLKAKQQHNSVTILPQPEQKAVDKQPSITTQAIFDYWNSKEIIVHRVLTKDIQSAIQKALDKKYTPEMIRQAIDHYSDQCHLLNSWHNSNPSSWLTLQKFLKQSNGMATWLDKLPSEDTKPSKQEKGNMYVEKIDKGLF